MGKVDSKIINIMEKARKHVEGSHRNIPFSKKKEVRRAALLYWRAKVQLSKNQQVDESKMEIRRRITQINETEMNEEKVLEEYKKA